MICLIKSALDIPFCAMTYFQQQSFILSIGGVICQLVIAKGWTAPAVLILKTVVDPSISSLAIAMFLLVTNVVNSAASLVMGYVSRDVDPVMSPHKYGIEVSAFTIIPCALSLPFFLFSGLKMRNIKLENKKKMTDEDIKQDKDVTKNFAQLGSTTDHMSTYNVDLFTKESRNNISKIMSISNPTEYTVRSINKISVMVEKRVERPTMRLPNFGRAETDNPV